MVGGSLVDDVPVSSVVARLDFRTARAAGGPLYVVYMVIFAKVSIPHSRLCYDSWRVSVKCAECV